MNSTSVRSYKSENDNALAPYLQSWARVSSVNLREDRAELASRSAVRFAKTVAGENSLVWQAMRNAEACGLGTLSMLPWDSVQLGFPAARLDYLLAHGDYDEQRDIKRALLKRLVHEAAQANVRHLSVRIDAADLSSLHTLEEAGFITVDSLLTYALELPLARSVALTSDFNLRFATRDDAEATASLARHAFSQDRFHADPLVSKERADELHATWLRNSCSGEAADAVILAEDSTGLLGFLTCRLQRDAPKPPRRSAGTIVLVASANSARGRGVGQAMTMAALNWFRDQSCEIVEVGTQLSNISASRLYQKCDFRLAGSSISLRLAL